MPEEEPYCLEDGYHGESNAYCRRRLRVQAADEIGIGYIIDASPSCL